MVNIVFNDDLRQLVASVRGSSEEFYQGIARLKDAGFRWNRERKFWFGDLECASRLNGEIDSDTRREIQKALGSERSNVQSSRAVDVDLKVPAPRGLHYYGFQKAGIQYASERKDTLIADEPGLGKTIQAVGISNLEPSIRRVLIICPASLKLNWKLEWEKWDVKRLSVGIVQPKELSRADVLIVNYELLPRYSKEFHAREYDLLIVDEAHALKSPNAKRTIEVLGKRYFDWGSRRWVEIHSPIRAKRRVFLTGTPICNRPAELWGIVQAFDPSGLGRSKSRYEQRYCGAYDGYWGWDSSGASNLAELQRKLRAAFMVRRLKKDVLTELPSKTRQVILLEPSTSEERQLVAKDKVLFERLEKEGGVGKLKAASALFEEIAAARKMAALAKLSRVIEHARELLEETKKLVIFAHHHEILDKLADAFGSDAVLLDGRVPVPKRQSIVDRFQNGDNTRVLIAGIQVAGLGFTLTAANVALFAEGDWVPANLNQAEDRLHRIGQDEPVLVQHLVLNGSIDAYMTKVVIAKQKVITSALDKRPKRRLLPEPVIRRRRW